MRRRLLTIVIFFFAGAAVNVAVAWGCRLADIARVGEVLPTIEQKRGMVSDGVSVTARVRHAPRVHHVKFSRTINRSAKSTTPSPF